MVSEPVGLPRTVTGRLRDPRRQRRGYLLGSHALHWLALAHFGSSSVPLQYIVISASGLLKSNGHLPCQNRGIASQRAHVETGQPNGVAQPILLGLHEIDGVF